MVEYGMESELDILKAAREVFTIEGQALEKTAQALDDSFVQIVNLIQDCKGKVVLTGMGKPGHIATKIAATLSSLGTPSFFMHPAEGLSSTSC
jgi:arabinose-5-phosphate isomerase